MTSIGTRLYTWRFGKQVGEDAEGNTYFCHKDSARDQRWVCFPGKAEATAVPPEWHAWLHRAVDETPKADAARQAFVKPHQANATGTGDAYRPPGHDYLGGKRSHATGDYEAWTPE